MAVIQGLFPCVGVFRLSNFTFPSEKQKKSNKREDKHKVTSHGYTLAVASQELLSHTRHYRDSYRDVLLLLTHPQAKMPHSASLTLEGSTRSHTLPSLSVVSIHAMPLLTSKIAVVRSRARVRRATTAHTPKLAFSMGVVTRRPVGAPTL